MFKLNQNKMFISKPTKPLEYILSILAEFWLLLILILVIPSCSKSDQAQENNPNILNLDNSMVQVKFIASNDTADFQKRLRTIILDTLGWKCIDDLTETDLKINNHLVIKYTVDVSRLREPAISFSGKRLQMAIYEDSCLLYSNVDFSAEAKGFITKVIPFISRDSATIYHHFYYKNFLETPFITFVRIGERSELLNDVIVIGPEHEVEYSSLAIGFFVITIGFISVISGLLYRGRNKKMLLFFALFSIASGVDSLEFIFAQLLDLPRSFVTILMFGSSLLSPLGFIGFLQYGIENSRSQFLRIAFWFSVLWIILFIALLIASPIVVIYWGGLLTIVLLICIAIYRERIYRRREFLFPMLSLAGLMLILVENALCDFNVIGFKINPDYGILILVFSLVIYVVKNIRESNLQIQLVKTELEQSQNRLLTLENQNIQSQFDALRGQINPHFLFNSLNTLASLINIDTNRATRFVEEFSNVYRRLLGVKGDILITVDEEMKFLKSYIYLQEIRFGQNLQFHVEIPEQCLDKLLTPLSIQLLVENALKHNEISEDFPLHVTISADDNYVYVTNPLNPKTSGIAKPSGIGLENLKKRYSQITDIKPMFIRTSSEYIAQIPILCDI